MRAPPSIVVLPESIVFVDAFLAFKVVVDTCFGEVLLVNDVKQGRIHGQYQLQMGGQGR